MQRRRSKRTSREKLPSWGARKCQAAPCWGARHRKKGPCWGAPHPENWPPRPVRRILTLSLRILGHSLRAVASQRPLKCSAFAVPSIGLSWNVGLRTVRFMSWLLKLGAFAVVSPPKLQETRARTTVSVLHSKTSSQAVPTLMRSRSTLTKLIQLSAPDPTPSGSVFKRPDLWT